MFPPTHTQWFTYLEAEDLLLHRIITYLQHTSQAEENKEQITQGIGKSLV